MADNLLASILMNGPNFQNTSNYGNPTPEQIANQRAYANGLLQPQPVHRWTQGLANMVSALVGGNASHQADVAQQQAVQNAQQQFGSLFGGALSQGRGGVTTAPQPAPPMSYAPTDDGSAPSDGDPAAKAAPTFAGMQGAPSGAGIASVVTDQEAKNGLPPGYLSRVAQLESGGNPDAHNGSSKGLYGFMPSTAKAYGLTDPFDPASSTAAAGALTHDNAVQLARALGHDPTPEELYIAHQQGAGGAAKLLQNPNARAGDLVGDAAIAQNGGNPDAPASAFTGKWESKFDGAKPMAFSPGSPMSSTPGQLAIGGAMQGGSQGGAPGAQALAAVMANPWISDHQKSLAFSLMEPQIVSDGIGNQYSYRPGTTAQPVLPGALVSHSNVGGIDVPTVTSGTPGNVRSQIVVPQAGSPPPVGQGAPSPPPPGGNADPGAGTGKTSTNPFGALAPLVQGAAQIQNTANASKIANDTSAQGAADQAKAFEATVNGANGNRAILSNLQDKLGKIVTGPNADKWNTFKAGANAAADIANLPEGMRFDKDRIAASEEFNKLAVGLAQDQASRLGSTDAKLDSALHSNPNGGLSTEGNRQILQMLQGNQDAIEAKGTAWRQFQKQAQQTGQPADFNAFNESFNRDYSPRAFQWVHMNPAEKEDMVKHMNPVERGQLATALRTARQRGWVPPDQVGSQ